MDKKKADQTIQMWKDDPKVEYWLEAIREPAKHMDIHDNRIVTVSSQYMKAVEGLSFLLQGKETVKISLEPPLWPPAFL